ncbi:hypothetical protein Hdeb2414_s0060g00761931 [Helianthus debilis subsp. tardiflorus]
MGSCILNQILTQHKKKKNIYIRQRGDANRGCRGYYQKIKGDSWRLKGDTVQDSRLRFKIQVRFCRIPHSDVKSTRLVNVVTDRSCLPTKKEHH